jgi:hypothetical protein
MKNNDVVLCTKEQIILFNRKELGNHDSLGKWGGNLRILRPVK